MALAIPVALAVGCGAADQPSIVLISIDTLRSDRLPAYGYDGIATPHIDALRADSILFEHAYSPTPTTLPAHATMLTGLLPPEHGVRGNIGYALESDRLPYLPVELQEAGYATGASVAAFVMRGETGFGLGFDHYGDDIEYRADAGLAGFQRTGGETLEAVRPWIRTVADRPFFLFLHLYDPHTPYTPSEPYASRYPSTPYEAEIAAVDEVIGDLVAELRELGVYDKSVVVLTSDHGEGLGDHGEAEHGIFLYREAIQVPLLLKLPGGERAGESVGAAAQLADVAPTLRALAGTSSEAAEAVVGGSLLELGDDSESRSIYSETFFPRFYFGWSELISVIDGRHQLIDSPEPELFDLVADPAQVTNLFGANVNEARRLRQLTRSYDAKLVEPADTDVETWSKMASLGYVGHGQTRVDAELPPPASQAHLLESVRRGLDYAFRGQSAAAVTELAAVVRENPYMLVAWEQLGHSLERLGRMDDARRAYLRALELSGSAPHLSFAAARTSLRVGELEQAKTLAEAGLDWDQASGRTLLGEIALAAGDLETAELEARVAADLRIPNSSALFTLAQVHLRRGEFEDALAVADRNEREVGRPVPLLDMLRANIFASMSRFDDAEAALRREIEHFPNGPAAYARLALFLARQGRPDEALETIRRLVDRNPTPQGFLAAARTFDTLGDPTSAQAMRDEARRRFTGGAGAGS